jgi:hypothetical protein
MAEGGIVRVVRGMVRVSVEEVEVDGGGERDETEEDNWVLEDGVGENEG